MIGAKRQRLDPGDAHAAALDATPTSGDENNHFRAASLPPPRHTLLSVLQSVRKGLSAGDAAAGGLSTTVRDTLAKRVTNHLDQRDP